MRRFAKWKCRSNRAEDPWHQSSGRSTCPGESRVQHHSPGQAHRELAQLEDFFTVVSESPEVYREWVNLVTRYSVRGVQAHDARLVAAMKVYTIRRLLTFDTEDFSRYQDIEVIHPQSLGRQP